MPSGAVGGWSATVALGRAMVGGEPAPPGRTAPVGAEVAKRMVGAGDMVGAPAARSGMVGAGAGGRGAPPAVAVGGPPGTGGRTGGAIGTVAEGTAGGASAAFKVTRTVSFFRGTLDVCLDGAGGWFSFSLMRLQGFDSFEISVRQLAPPLSNPQLGISAIKTEVTSRAILRARREIFDALFAPP